MNKDYFLPAGDTDAMVLDPLSFEEFLSGAGKRELYEKISLTGDDPHESYDELRDLYDIYIHIGGYPAVVKHLAGNGRSGKMQAGACRDHPYFRGGI